MKIHFSNVNFSSQTGPNSFAYRLAQCLSRRNHEIVAGNQKYDIFLAFIEADKQPAPDSKIVQRLDGIWFKPEEFESKNVGIRSLYNVADHIVWQSEFDKTMITTHWGNKEGSVIHNGIQMNINIAPANVTDKNIKRIFVTSASWHKQKRLKDNIRFFHHVKKANDVLVILGSQPDVDISHFNDVFYLGHKTHEECLSLYKRADWMLHLAWLDHCPNVVVEALSQNLPVVCTNSGGTKEIVRNNGLIIEETHEYNFELTDYDNPPDISFENIKLPDKKIDVNADYLDIECVADMYETVFNTVLTK